MAAAIAERRAKASTRNVRKGVYLTDGEDLYEVRACRGVKVLKAGPNEIPMIEAVRLVNVRGPLPYQLSVELREGAWIPFDEVLPMEVVVPVTAAVDAADKVHDNH